jgi:hypothetical protein
MNGKALILVCGGAVLCAALMLPGQSGDRQWRMWRDRDGDVQFSIEEWKSGSHMSTRSTVPLSRFRGLPDELSGPVKFEYIREAGRLICQGRFTLGWGSGTFTLAPDPDFTAELQRLGYEAPNEDQLFNMLLSGFTLDFARAAKDAGLQASTSQLIDMRNHGLDAAYIRKTQDAGYRKLTVGDFIELKNHGVDPGFLRDLKYAGYELSARQVCDLRNHGVGSDFLRDLKHYGLQPSAEEIVQLRDNGVAVEFLRDAKALGYEFTTRELIDLRNNGVDGGYLRRIHDSGMRNLTAAQIRKLKNNGID